MTQDISVSFHPYFKIHSGKVDDFRALCSRFIEKTRTETGCLFYGFTFNEDIVFCREAYVDAAALLAHAESVGALIQEALTISDLIRLEAHGPETELAKLREPLAGLKPQYFALYDSFRR